jgi:hypothetical protein
MTPPFKILSMAIFFAASGCASVPNGPSVMVMPASGATFSSFEMMILPANNMRCLKLVERPLIRRG